MKVLYIGSSGPLSLVPFKKLLSTENTVTAVGVYKPIIFNDKLIAIENESLALAARQRNIPLLDLSQPLGLLLEQCHEVSIDIILMACYSKRLPEAVIKLAAKGCFNLHPSLLPRFRGPEPVFWQMRAASMLGVTWHQVIYDFDAGDIAVQKKIILDDGDSYIAINKQLAETGADIMIDLLSDISVGGLTLAPQNSELASYDRYPQQKDFVIDRKWTARQAYNFMCSTRIFDVPYQCQVGRYNYLLKQALDYDNNITLEEVEIQSDRIYIPCMEGVLIANYIDKIDH